MWKFETDVTADGRKHRPLRGKLGFLVKFSWTSHVVWILKSLRRCLLRQKGHACWNCIRNILIAYSQAILKFSFGNVASTVGYVNHLITYSSFDYSLYIYITSSFDYSCISKNGWKEKWRSKGSERSYWHKPNRRILPYDLLTPCGPIFRIVLTYLEIS